MDAAIEMNWRMFEGAECGKNPDAVLKNSWFLGKHRMENTKQIKILTVALAACLLAGFCNAAEVTVGPYVHFYERGKVTVFWKTDTAVASIIDYGARHSLSDPPDLSLQVQDAAAKTDHQLDVPIKPESLYNYRITAGAQQDSTYEFYSAFDYGPDPFPGGDNPYPPDALTPLYAQAAQYIADQLQFTKGYCIDYGCGQGRLAYELAKRTDLKIIGFEADPAKVAAARNALHQADIYGTRVTVIQADLSNLDCTDYSANLIVSDKMIADGICSGTAAEMFRILRPAGGMAILGQPPSCPSPLSEATLDAWLGAYGNAVTNAGSVWAIINRPALAGAGEWTHNWANPAATTCSEDTVVAYPAKMAWYGQPGPRYIVDRHHRPGCSLYKDGRLVVPGLHRVMAVDAYNGARLWDLSVPNSVRVGVMKDAGWVALASDYTYVAAWDDCVGLNPDTGQPTLFFAAPQEISGQTLDWGYLATDGDQLFGSAQKENASRIGHDLRISESEWGFIYQIYKDNQAIVTSRYLFCFDRDDDSSTPWIYKQGGSANSAIINPTICISDDAVYFIESRNSSAYNDADGRVTLATLFNGNNEYLVKLNRTNGNVIWARQFNFSFANVAWLHYADNKVFATGSWGTSPNWTYGVYAFGAGDGYLEPAWTTNPQTFPDDNMGDDFHGGQDKHPAIVGNSIYWQRDHKFNLQTGATQSGFSLGQSGCGTMSTTANYAFTRSAMTALTGGGGNLCSEIRDGCYINTIGAGGMALVPESSSGCVCYYPMQASMGFIPN
jgi:SAM-dependent methyltransferase